MKFLMIQLTLQARCRSLRQREISLGTSSLTHISWESTVIVPSLCHKCLRRYFNFWLVLHFCITGKMFGAIFDTSAEVLQYFILHGRYIRTKRLQTMRKFVVQQHQVLNEMLQRMIYKNTLIKLYIKSFYRKYICIFYSFKQVLYTLQ